MADLSSSHSAECPICHSLIPLDHVNGHIDQCLHKDGSDSRMEPIKKGCDKIERKRQSMLAFNRAGAGRESPSTSAKMRKVESSASCVTADDTSAIFSAEVDTSQPFKCNQVEASLKNSITFAVPLAELVRPTTIEEFVGQESVVGDSSFLHLSLQSGDVPSLIFWGPPGCGKTTLARIIARRACANGRSRFVQLSAASSGLADVKEAVRIAKNQKLLMKKQTLLFIDEIHRFNKLQQDAFLPHVENGTITLLGATTENPSFQVNSALLSRCRVVVLNKLQTKDIKCLLTKTLVRLGVGIVDKDAFDEGRVCIKEEAVTALAELCDGDGRIALNCLQLVIQTKRTLQTQLSQTKDGNIGNSSTTGTTSLCVSIDYVKGCLQKNHLLYDRAGDEHFHSISALHKSMRGGDANASLYWLSRMLCGGEDPLYIARRVIRFASEDVGLEDPNALPQAVSAFNACKYIGMPECEVILAQAVIYMARAPKAVEVYMAYKKAKACVKNHRGPLPPIPLHLRNAPTQLMRDLDFGKGYKYNPDFPDDVQQTYMPEELKFVNFF